MVQSDKKDPYPAGIEEYPARTGLCVIVFSYQIFYFRQSRDELSELSLGLTAERFGLAREIVAAVIQLLERVTVERELGVEHGSELDFCVLAQKIEHLSHVVVVRIARLETCIKVGRHHRTITLGRPRLKHRSGAVVLFACHS